MEIERICGVKPEGIVYFDPGNNPNFVFESDPSFQVLKLYDVDGNLINVNSWFECAHYVNGGWTTNQLLMSNSLKYLSFTLLLLSIGLSVLVLLKKRNVLKESKN